MKDRQTVSVSKTTERRISIVYNGVCVRKSGQFYHSDGFATLLRELGKEFGNVCYFGFCLDGGDKGSDHTAETALTQANLEMFVVRGNTSETRPWTFVGHYVAALWQLGKFLTRSAQFVVFVPSFISAVAAVGAVLLGKRFGVYIGGNWSEETRYRDLTFMQWLAYPVTRFAVDPIGRWAARRAEFVITAGYDSHERLRGKVRRLMLPAPLLRVTRRDVSYKENTCEDGEIVVLFVGALRVQKGVLDLLHAFAAARKRLPERRLALWYVGSGEAESRLESRVNELRLRDIVKLLGHVPNGPALFSLYQTADVFALPTYSEGFPRSLYEAMTFALPIVTTPVGGIPYLLRGGEHALFVEPGNVDDLENGLVSLITDPALRSRLIDHARRLMLESVYPRIEHDGSLAKQIRAGFGPAFAPKMAP